MYKIFFTSLKVFFLCSFLFITKDALAGIIPDKCLVPQKIKNSFYIDPVNGNSNGNGSITNPWKSLSDIISRGLINGEDNSKGIVHAGDAIYLKSGDYGVVSLTESNGKFNNKDFITIQAAPNSKPVFSQLTLRNVNKWVITGLDITSVSLNGNQYHKLVSLTGDNIIFQKNNIYSANNVDAWTPNDWNNLAAYIGLNYSGNCGTIVYNSIKNNKIGAGITGNNINFSYNSIDGFANDGLDFAGTTNNPNFNTLIGYNSITNHYGFLNNGNHNDGIQGWSHDNLVRSNLKIIGNIVTESTGDISSIPAMPANTSPQDYLQGISIFDGRWTNLTVSNNVVQVSAYCALTFYGITNSLLVNNTVVKLSSNPIFAPRIGLFTGKDGSPISKVIVRNNIANLFIFPSSGVLEDHNISISNYRSLKHASDQYVSNPALIFKSYTTNGKYDLSLINGSPAIGAGTASSAPAVDVLGIKRNRSKIDIGAYSYR